MNQLSPHVEKMLDLRRNMELDRFHRIHDELTVDDLMSRFRHHDTCGCSTHDDVPAAVSPLIFWPVVCAFSLLMTFGSCELATRVIPLLLRWLA